MLGWFCGHRSEGRQRKSQHCLFAHFRQVMFNIRNGSSGKRPWWEHHEKQLETYSKNRRIVGDSRRLLVLGRRRAFFNPQVLDICAAKDDVLVELLRRRDELVGIVFAVLGAERPHIFEGDGRVIRVDAVEGAGIANIAPGDEGDSGSVPGDRSQ